MGTETKTFWIARDQDGKMPYAIFSANPTIQTYSGGTYWSSRSWLMGLCRRKVHALTDIRLKPGEGPIEVQLVPVKRAAKKKAK